MFKKVLIANRGEIALRVIRACHELGIKTVAVYSTADELSLHVKFADEAVCIGPPASSDSYLNIPRIIAAGEITGADAIHPGYGFLSESAQFSKICEENGFAFLGASPEIIDAMGNKAQAKITMKKAGVPVVPGGEGILDGPEDAKVKADEMGYPVMLKASAGGGGRGMRLVKKSEDVIGAFKSANQESLTAFGNGDMYIEKFIQNPRHIEVQILADSHGNAIHLGERECSIQRRHQKLVEESPSAFVDEETRKEIGDAAVAGAKAVNYVGVGTIEFLMDKDKNYFFMEMNTRIQVEHPVTEMVTGVDLIKQQIKMHAGFKCPEYLQNFKLRGHSIECRINAEDPANNFMPFPGEITNFHMPGGKGVRVDSHAYSGYKIPTQYDSMIGKIIVHAKNRERAIIRMYRALEETIIEGPKTTIPYQMAIMDNEQFKSGVFDTSFLETFDYDPEKYAHKGEKK
ncbi:MAG: acetyl-CoA carboxylase biotin carboxylase subunit [Candidatus Marinimicrobia bacterium]|jgi:acetyl-CoA carboxylase biotin carboxylase subunit|nr:acetyl-CoA carboxylase biotin carboxylase subunit [Candidatus Neomarinimicrobiota bacterium]MBT3501107.1 acetyl-CoA carboxylase biotin carboxylase subunit [Candidatus Neomarinimicrobiota bacterium]MBT3840503.1 acetyl-CoA carboxylase biotin carboxylase subunit [Candidatus Neomarinimicrobiota bacterium]MBT3999354.1 acetyl-CoA carboxylase biotin carboxylase subunit [Candidatus Neomarinimicrobiota bacterium]MBT4578439.1 acetyl-CoA carboxylase biotin carboxylase subunit [Candidatus Neomarinimicro